MVRNLPKAGSFSDLAGSVLAGSVLAGLLVIAVAGPVRAASPDGIVPNKVIEAVVDQARLVRVPAGTTTLIIGNPTIADVTLLRPNNLMVLTPKAFGETNFIALDAAGNPVAESSIRVVNSDDAVVVQRGMERQSYSCAPRCQPTERLGDDEKYLTAVANQDQAHNSRLSSSQAPVSVGPR